MNDLITLYKEYIRRCTDSKNSVENYSDFKRLNDLIIDCIDQNFKRLENCTVSDVDLLQSIYDKLLTFEKFELFKDNKSNKDKDFVHIGGGQYYNALKTFIRFLNAMKLFSSNKQCGSSTYNDLPLQQIFYGAPGTGKSHKVKEITGEDKEGDKPNVFRTTFHPDTDYASFVGCYKPVMKPVPDKYQTVAGRDEDIAYEFVPQAFTDAYVYAYNHANEPTYLVIEEINRGNCAQIFGDLFQLLDRNENGTSDYKIKADKDLAKYLSASLNSEDGIKDGKLSLPANLYILATMNTSDQSLFPIDSAFKRRWDWEYVAIDYNDHKSSAFEIKIGADTYSWVEFIKKVNKRIYDVTQSEDKMMGNFFIKSSVDQKQFCSKVMFYLWNEVLKDEVENTKYFFYEDRGNNQTAKFTFTDIYSENATEILVNFMKYIGFTDKKTQETPNPNQPAEGEAQ